METNSLSIPIKALTRSEQILSGEAMANSLLEIHDAKTSYVLLAQLENLTDTAKKFIKEKAIANVNGKEEDVLGAKVTIKQATRIYEYKGSEYDRLLSELNTAKDNFKNHTKILEMSKDGWVNPNTGETETANLISSGVNIAVTFSKEK